jgi:beta-mannosidase
MDGKDRIRFLKTFYYKYELPQGGAMRGIQNAVVIAGLCAIAIWSQQVSEITGWKMQDSAVVGATPGTTISTASYSASTWYTATVPGTVLGTLVDQGVYSDPYVGNNMLQIPDLAAQQRRYWFRGTFDVTLTTGQRVWLELGGINYFATIFVNGTQVGTMYGAFKEGKFDITGAAISGTNYVAVKIRGNYTPTTYHQQQSGSCGANGGNMSGDGPTIIAAQGWDWIPTIPDRDMGIWKPVYVRVTGGGVTIRHPWIRTLNVSASSATVPLQVMLRNGSGTAVTGTVAADINGTMSFTSQTVTVPANDTLNVNFPNLTMTNPALWWPNGYGAPNLYTCNISFTPTSASSPSDTTTFRFGVRQWTISVDGSGYLLIACNGQRILIRGGNWGIDEAMKRWNLHRLENQVRYQKEMNFNVIRDWIGMTDNEPFYNFCDQYGLIVWADFWEPHQADMGTSTVTDQANFIANMQDKIYRVRNHASVAVWCERNETTPTAAFLTALTNFHSALDGTRYVQSSSGLNGVHSGGPYCVVPVSGIYQNITGFHTEFGLPTVPSFQSMKSFLAGDTTPVAINIRDSVWSFHNFCSGNGFVDLYTGAISSQFGAPTNLTQFCQRAQLLNYESYKGAFESLHLKRFAGANGLMLWMSSPAWPSTMWQPFDWYMEGTGSMYGAQEGSEPVHVMRNNNGDNNISVVNNTMSALSNYSVTASTYNLNGTRAWTFTKTGVNVNADAINTNVLATAVTAGSSTPYFLDLKLKDGSGNLVSHNFYWIPDDYTVDISSMMNMTAATVAATGDAEWTRSDTENTITLKIVNTGTVCAVVCRLMLTGTTSGNRILPCHFSDNYFSLIPGDTQNVTIKFDEVDRNNEIPKLCLTGVNVAQTCFTVNSQGIRNGISVGSHISRLAVGYSNGKIRLFNVPFSQAWNIRIVDMLGHTALDAEGVAKVKIVDVPSARRLTPGCYIAMISTAGQQLRTMFMVTGR